MSDRAKKSPAVILRRIRKMEEREVSEGPNAGRQAYIARLKQAVTGDREGGETNAQDLMTKPPDTLASGT